MSTIKIKLTLLEELLGTSSANPELYEEFIASRRPEEPDPEEVAALPPVSEEVEKQTTVFARENGQPILWDYQIKGFFKDACGSLRRVPDTHSAKLKAYKKEIDGLIFVLPRKIGLAMPAGGEIGICSRPLRAQTAQGERVALARSETVPAGTTLEVEISMLNDNLEAVVHEWLHYGKLRGLGQWRNSGKGRFAWALVG